MALLYQVCRLCKLQVSSLSQILEHFSQCHPGAHPFECDVCGHRSMDEVKLKKHLQCHEPGRPKEYCNICYKEFRNKVSLRTHKNMVHKVNEIWLHDTSVTVLLYRWGSSILVHTVVRSSTRHNMSRNTKLLTLDRSSKQSPANTASKLWSTQKYFEIFMTIQFYNLNDFSWKIMNSFTRERSHLLAQIVHIGVFREAISGSTWELYTRKSCRGFFQYFQWFKR